MRTILRVLNVVIMVLAAAAAVFLFMPPSFAFTSRITINVDSFSEFVPETEFSKDIDIAGLLGTNELFVGIKFKLDVAGISEMKDGSKEKIDNNIVSPNIKEMVSLLHEPVDLMTDFFIRDNMTRIIHQQITNYVDEAREKYDTSHAIASTTEEIMEDVGMDEEYFTNFSYALYDAANADGATVDSASEVLFNQIDDALAKAEESGMVDTSGFDHDSMSSVKDSLVGVLQDLNLVEEDGSLKKISQISYLYLSEYLKDQMKETAPAEELEQKTGETIPDYADRLLEMFVLDKMPEVFYQAVGYVSLGLFIGLFVFAGIWALLIVITLLKTISKKPWTFFGPWFWLVGLVELFLGFGITALARFALPKLDISQFGLPISAVDAYVRTYALVPSILFVASMALAIVYQVFKSLAKKEARAANE